MREISKKYNYRFAAGLFAGSFLFLFFILTTPVAQAAGTSTVRGVGWWGDSLKKVYFNCLDDEVGDYLDNQYNLNSGHEDYDPEGAFHFYSAPCASLVHGVYIDSNNNFSGQAWNPNKGLISFSGTSTPPDESYGLLNAHCPSVCNANNNCWSCYNEIEQKVYGWARVDKTKEWIRLDATQTFPSQSVYLQTCNQASVYSGQGVSPGDFFGNAGSSLGSLSFNCKSESGVDTCNTRNYRVYIGNLSIGNLSAPNLPNEEACKSTALAAHLKWCVRSGSQTAYEIVVNTSDNLSTSSNACWSGKQSSGAQQYNIPSSFSGHNCSLEYNKHYFWWIRLFDELDQPTGWYQYFGNTIGDTDVNRDGNPKTFSTYLHEFPSPYFLWTPYNILVGTTTAFASAGSKYFTSANPSSAVECSGPNCCTGPNCKYFWDTSDSGALILSRSDPNPDITFKVATNTKITLEITDSENYTCSYSAIATTSYNLPIWHEIKAK